MTIAIALVAGIILAMLVTWVCRQIDRALTAFENFIDGLDNQYLAGDDADPRNIVFPQFDN